MDLLTAANPPPLNMLETRMNKTALIASTLLGLVALGACAHAGPTASETSASAVAAPAAPAASGDLTLSVSGVRAGAGPVMVALFNETGWAGEAGPVRAAAVPADGAVVSHVFEDLPAGSYGVRLYQDVDADGALDANPFGIPTEPYGFSNNAPVRFGPPGWDAAAFAVSGDAAHAIALPE